jgi:hypothetical protein
MFISNDGAFDVDAPDPNGLINEIATAVPGAGALQARSLCRTESNPQAT